MSDEGIEAFKNWALGLGCPVDRLPDQAALKT